MGKEQRVVPDGAWDSILNRLTDPGRSYRGLRGDTLRFLARTV
jgi:hypothetical protein